MTATDSLRKDHEFILEAVKLLALACDRIEAGLQCNKNNVEKLVDFFRDFVDSVHHAKEEKILFPLLEKAGIPRENGPLGVMMNEHNEGRVYLESLHQLVLAWPPNANASLSFVRMARSYIGFISDHIFKENNVLFSIAEQVLEEAQRNDLKEQLIHSKSLSQKKWSDDKILQFLGELKTSFSTDEFSQSKKTGCCGYCHS